MTDYRGQVEAAHTRQAFRRQIRKSLTLAKALSCSVMAGSRWFLLTGRFSLRRAALRSLRLFPERSSHISVGFCELNGVHYLILTGETRPDPSWLSAYSVQRPD
jgi:hypothetical protein